MKYFYNLILILWAVFVIAVATYFLTVIPPDVGEVWGSLFPAYLLVVVAFLFLGRFAIERIINKLKRM